MEAVYWLFVGVLTGWLLAVATGFTLARLIYNSLLAGPEGPGESLAEPRPKTRGKAGDGPAVLPFVRKGG